jgi:GAF domain-containing protein
MHELNFAIDVVSGAEFVLGIVNKAIPAELVMIHLFDINTQQFVIVRASGPDSEKTLLYRTANADPLFEQAMRRAQSLHTENARADERYRGGRWDLVRAVPNVAACGGAKQGGRYLGVIEIINPLGGDPFHQAELNALDYICEQFATFLAQRPIVVDAEFVLGQA